MKTSRSSSIALLLALILAAAPAAAQSPDASMLTLDRLFSSREFVSDRFGPARWLADGSGYTTVELSRSVRGLGIVKYDPTSGSREVLVSAEQLIPPGARAPLILQDYEWSQDGTKLLIFTNTRRVWRTNSRGDYWVLDLESGELEQLGGDVPEATLMFAKFSPRAERVAYVQANDIYVERLSDERITRLTSGGSPTLINGTFDWAYEEEFQIQDGFRWSPDGERIAYWQLDASGVRDFVLANYTEDLYPVFTTIPYPKVGERLSAARVGVVSASGGQTTWMDIPGDPRNQYIPRMQWAANSHEIAIQHMNRAQNTNRVLMGNAETGEVRTVYTDTDPAWLEVVDEWRWFEDGSRFTWVSERGGWRQFYGISRDGEEQLLTPWAMDVFEIVLIDMADGWLYYVASPDNPNQRYLYRSLLDGTGEPERLTPQSEEGTNSYQISPDGRYAFQTHSAIGIPTQVHLVSLPDHRRIRTMMDNAELNATVKGLARGDFEFFRVDIGEVELDGWIMKPPDFDPTRRYPLLFYVYGEPWSSTVQDRWGGSRYLWHLMLTQQGYLVASIDNRGVNVPRGREWRKIIHGNVGTLASADQAAANREMQRNWSFIDGDRIGIWGWSGGGSMTLNMMFRYPELYQTGMSVAPVPDQRYYDAIYQERYSGLLDDNAEGYREGSPISHVDGLEGNLLLVHGTGDDNVHYQGSEALINAMIERGKHFTMMAYPNRSHGIFEGPGTTRHVYGLLTRYLEDNLPPGAAPIG